MDYLYFTFDGVSSQKYNLTITNNGEDLTFPSQPTFTNNVVSPLYQGASYLAGVDKKDRIFVFKCWVDSITSTQMRDMLQWLSVDKIGALILDYNPNFYYNVKLNSLGDFTHYPFNEDGTVNYGFDLSFTTIGDAMAISNTKIVIGTPTVVPYMLNQSLLPAGIYIGGKIKLFNFYEESFGLNVKITNSASFEIKKNATTIYKYTPLAVPEVNVDTKYGFCKIGAALAESIDTITTTTNLGTLLVPSGSSQVLNNNIASWSTPTITINNPSKLITYSDLTNVYFILQNLVPTTSYAIFKLTSINSGTGLITGTLTNNQGLTIAAGATVKTVTFVNATDIEVITTAQPALTVAVEISFNYRTKF